MNFETENNAQIYLASQSPRRQQLLRQIGIKFQQHPTEIDELPMADELAEDYVCRMAREKAQQAWENIVNENKLPVLAADTSVVLNSQILGKPRDKEHALEMLSRLSNNQHQVLSAVALLGYGHTKKEYCNQNVYRAPKLRVLINCSTVTLRAISEQERLYYWETGEPIDKAGGYAVQGLGAVFIKNITGSYSSVMGLPLYETEQLLTEFGIAVLHA